MFRLKRFRLTFAAFVLTIVALYYHFVGTTYSDVIGSLQHAPQITPAEEPTPLPRNVITGDELLPKKPDEEYFVQADQARLEVRPLPSGKPKPRWKQQKEHFPVQNIITMPTGQARQLPKIQHNFKSESSNKKADRTMKQNAVREAFQHAWSGYKSYAYGHDELRPISNTTSNPFMGWGATLVDALDTMWIMDLKDDFEDAVRMVAKIDFKTSARKDIPMFETTIRYLGGLLGAYDVSDRKYSILLDKAVELADILMGAFDTPNRMPIPFYNWRPSYASQAHRASTHIVLAELGTLAMEFTRLSQLTREHKYYDAVARITDALEEWQMHTTYPGVWPLHLDASGCKKPQVDKFAEEFDSLVHLEPDSNFAKRQAVGIPPVDEPAMDQSANKDGVLPKPWSASESSDDEDDDDVFASECPSQGLNIKPNSESQTYVLGGGTDSAYEYLPKMHSLLGGLNQQYKSMYEKSMGVIRTDFLFKPMIKEDRDILFLKGHKLYSKPEKSADPKETWYEGSHLGCFIGGMFALGSKVFDIPGDMNLASKLTDACVWAYESMPSGIMPEFFYMVPCEAKSSPCVWNETRWHDFLDPYRHERFAAVEKYNQAQKALSLSADNIATNEEQLSSNSSSNVPDPTIFEPKVAMSHARYVAAKISENRLASGMTQIPSKAYKLRPEAIESVFIMYRLTGDETWREKGWKMFQSIDAATRTSAGHAQLVDVTSVLHELSDSMESFWFAETLKYFYLLFSDPDLISLDEWVFNTEAHMFRLPKGDL